jgi:hypothetical protein
MSMGGKYKSKEWQGWNFGERTGILDSYMGMKDLPLESLLRTREFVCYSR